MQNNYLLSAQIQMWSQGYKCSSKNTKQSNLFMIQLYQPIRVFIKNELLYLTYNKY